MVGFTELLKKRMEDRGFFPDVRQLDRFGIYGRELKDWNTKFNLTSLTDDIDIIDKHFVDSLLLFQYETLETGIRIADVGAGAGFPGLPIKIYRPDIRLTLLESVGKKTKFLEHIVAELKLGDVEVVNNRAEVVAHSPEHREQYELVVARCVAALPVLAEFCLPLVSLGGRFVAYKGSDEAESEVRDAGTAIDTLGGRLERIEIGDPANLLSRDADGRSLIFIDKVKQTPDKYPRRPGIARKRPL